MSTTPSQEKELIHSGVEKVAKHFLRRFDGARKLKQRWNKWITADCWMDIISERHEMPPDLKLGGENLNGAVARHPKFNGIDATKDTDIHGLHKASFKGLVGGKRRGQRSAVLLIQFCCLTSPAGMQNGATNW